VQGKRYKSAMADWAGSPWRELRFSLPQPQFYAYSYVSAGTGTGALYTATANGDLDGNGVNSEFVLTGGGSVTGDAQRISLKITNEDE